MEKQEDVFFQAMKQTKNEFTLWGKCNRMIEEKKDDFSGEEKQTWGGLTEQFQAS